MAGFSGQWTRDVRLLVEIDTAAVDERRMLAVKQKRSFERDPY